MGMKWMWNLIVAQREPASSGPEYGEPATRTPLVPRVSMVRARAWAACLLITAFALIGLWRALLEPSTGWRFGVTPDGRIQAVATDGRGEVLQDVSALTGGGQRVLLTPELLIESSGLLHLYADQDRFHATHRELWTVLQQPVVAVETASGTVTASMRDKRLGELGFYFWLPWGLGLLSLSVGLAVWVYRPADEAARWYALASMAYAYFMLLTAGSSSRLLTQMPFAWAQLHQLAHATGFFMIGAQCMLLLRHPVRLRLPWLPPLMLAWGLIWLSVDVLRLVPTIALGYRLPSVVMTLLLPMLFALQWRTCRSDPARRAQIKWLGLLMFASLLFAFIGFSAGAAGYNIKLPLVVGLGWQSLLFLGLVPLVTQVGLFQLERWWAYAWLWLLGGLLVVVLDVLLLAMLPVSGGNALALALAAGGWLYFPLRQAVWLRLARGSLPATRDVLPEIVSLIASQPQDSARLNTHWRALWDKACQPLRMETLPALSGEYAKPATELATEPAEAKVQVGEQGQTMWIPGWGGLHALRLFLPERGQRLFRPDDAVRAREIVRLVRTGLTSHQSFERGVREERQRIASDLHDDLGATLLSIAQTSSSGHTSGLARQAIEDLRLSVRGLTGDAIPLADALADWRSESVARVMAAGIDVQWVAADMASDTMLSAPLRTQMTRILREAVSNVIRHSGARHCRIEISATGGWMALDIHDDGKGMQGSGLAQTQGMGLANMERRARKLAGHYALRVSHLGGVHVQCRVPMGLSATMGAP